MTTPLRRHHSPADDTAASLHRGPPYRVPFHVDRSGGPHRLVLRNIGTETLTGVTVAVLRSGLLLHRQPAVVGADSALTVTVSGHDLPAHTVLVLRWFRPNGEEYLWRISF